MRSRTAWAVWIGLAVVVIAPVAIAAASPLQAYRGVSYIAASLAGILSLGLLLVQPLLAAGYLPGLTPARERRLHIGMGVALSAIVAVHVGGLLIASPPDAIDALLLVSPTPFSVWGVTAMWALIATAAIVALRGRIAVRPRTWRAVHNALAAIVVIGTVIHALQIEGTMGTASKWILCLAALAATGVASLHMQILRRRRAAR